MRNRNGLLELADFPPEYPQAVLEFSFIELYLAGKGYCRSELDRFSDEEARALLVEASIFASNKLAEIETRYNLVKNLSGYC